MSRLHVGLAFPGLLLTLHCSGAPGLTYHELGRPDLALARDTPAGETPDIGEEEIEREAGLGSIVSVALARNPDLLEAKARIRAALERLPAAGRLPDPELAYEQWGVPVRRPFALGDAEMLMLGVRQMFPAPGTLDARSRAAESEVRILVETLRARELELARQVKNAYYEYCLAHREYEIHREHAELTSRIVELGRARYAAGKSTQEDILGLLLELSRLHNDLANVEARQRASAALLNSLMARPPGARLGPPPEGDVPAGVPELAALERRALASRPEIAAARHRIEGREAALDQSRRAARWPSFMVGAQYMYMPHQDDPHAYGAMVSMSLPWLNPRSREEARAAEQEVVADRRALSSISNAALFEVHEAYARYQAARASFELLDRDLVPLSRQSLDATQSAFVAGGKDALGLLDALRSLLLVRLEHTRARVRLESSVVDLERAVGTPLGRSSQERSQP